MNQRDIDKVLSVAKSWVGYNFRPGQTAQCANFVRSVFEEAKVYVGVASHPSDEKLIPNEPKGASYADSFAGDDVGDKVPIDKPEPGDIVMYKNTYGNYPDGVITHVGIYEGNASIIHRPTANAPVRRDHYKYMPVAEIRRVPSDPSFLEISIIDNKVVSCYVDNVLIKDIKFKLFLNNGKLGLVVGDKNVKRIDDFNLFLKDSDSLYYFGKQKWLNNGKKIDKAEIVLTVKDKGCSMTVKGNKLMDVNMNLVLRYL